MSAITSIETRGLMEAYEAVYSSQQSLEEEIFESVAYALISQGYTATDVLEYFANVDEEVIIEDIVSIAEGTLLIEEVVAEEYLQEQYEILNEVVGAVLRLGMAAAKAAKYAPQGANVGQRALSALGGAGKAATRIAQQGTKASAVVRPAVQGAKNAIGGAVSKVKDLAKGALNKLPGGSGGKVAGALKTAGKWALGGAAFEAGTRGVKGLMGDKDSTASAKTTPAGPPSLKAKQDFAKSKGKYYSSSDQKTYKNYNDAEAAKNSRRGVKSTPTPPAPPKLPEPSSSSQGSSSSPAPAAPSKPASTPAKPASTPDTKLTDMQKWAKANPNLASRVKPGQSGYDDISATRDKPGPNEKKDQTPTQGNPDAKIDPKAVSDALKAQQDRDKKKVESASTTKESYDAYDILLDYLVGNGHVDTLDEAHYIMLEMDTETVGSIIEAAADQSDKQIDKGVKSTYKAQNVLDNQHQGRSKGLNKLPRGEREEKAKRMSGRLKSRRDDLFGERNKREDSKREKLKKMLGL